MLRVQILSDLHFEFHADHGDSFIDSFDSSKADVLVIAGDLATASLLERSLGAICNKFEGKDVVFVLGNHEYYGSKPEAVDKVISRCVNKFKNLHFLDKSAIVISGQRFIGATLWFEDDPMAYFYRRYLNDFSAIKSFIPWVFEENVKAKEYLEREVCAEDIVITHHMPSYRCVSPEYRNSNLNSFFVCDMERTIAKNRPKLWIFGHAHNFYDTKLGDTRLLCNPLGYPHEVNQKFDDVLVVNI